MNFAQRVLFESSTRLVIASERWVRGLPEDDRPRSIHPAKAHLYLEIVRLGKGMLTAWERYVREMQAENQVPQVRKIS